jgi:hypothetical protein
VLPQQVVVAAMLTVKVAAPVAVPPSVNTMLTEYE